MEYNICNIFTTISVGPPTELLQGYQGEELGVHDCAGCNCGQLLHHQLPHWFHSFGTKYSELILDTRGITLSMANLFLFMSHYVGGWL